MKAAAQATAESLRAESRLHLLRYEEAVVEHRAQGGPEPRQGRAKGAARQVKYLKELDRNRALFDEREVDDIGRLLGHTPVTLAAGRVELATAAREGKVELDDYLLYHWMRFTRDDWMMRESSGDMYERGWPALVG